MAVSSVSNTSSALDASGLTGGNAAGGADRFLKLLVAQMQNQDPLNPMDNAQVTSQMAQISTVTGIEKLTSTVSGLTSQFMQMQALQGASLVGRDVIVPGNLVDINDGVGQGGFELTGPADAVKVEILSPSGQIVKTLQLGAQSAGTHSFDWEAGSATNDSGLKFRVTATRGGVESKPTPLMRDHIDAVSTTGNGFRLELARSGSTAYDQVVAFN
ncbi:MAG: flagellar hook assembly protein FlgD [Piscinibacter sp.]|uniref:flagellar hook assembly protein FlgD n=1 Tax=Piscinibacter TaxID=1114981 RepID=UPI000FDDD35F|nr:MULTISPECIES: flagellar hook assembly protein FlgD [Piscinibacter]MCW5662265.1 flagellar hook assembly protein FlgD [Piscinibacter sp.]